MEGERSVTQDDGLVLTELPTEPVQIDFEPKVVSGDGDGEVASVRSSVSKQSLLAPTPKASRNSKAGSSIASLKSLKATDSKYKANKKAANTVEDKPFEVSPPEPLSLAKIIGRAVLLVSFLGFVALSINAILTGVNCLAAKEDPDSD